MNGGYAIRFEPVDGDEVARATAAYLSTDTPRRVRGSIVDIITTVTSDVQGFSNAHTARAYSDAPCVQELCAVDRLRAVVVPYAEAVADLEQT